MINRDLYMNFLKKMLSNSDEVKLLIGVRRSGKSTLLEMLQEYLLSIGTSKDKMIVINYELIQNDYLKEGKTLHKYIKEKITTDEMYFVFIDEAQEIEEWARVVNSLRVTFNVNIFVTGSNGRMLNGDHLTYLSGRYISINVFPLSYKELIDFKDAPLSNEEYYKEFLYSSFPRVLLENDEEVRQRRKQDIYEAIFERDIIQRGKIQNKSVFMSVARYVLENVGSPISIKKICDSLNSNGLKTAYTTVENYVDLIEKAFFLYRCERYDVKGKEVFKTLFKFYVVDFGIRNQLVPNANTNTGHILENFVYLELMKAGYSVHTGKIGRDHEIDFVATKGRETLFIQVTQTMLDPSVKERETFPLSLIKSNGKRIVLSLDTLDFGTSEFEHYNALEFVKLL